MYTLEVEVTPRIFTVLFTGYAEQDEYGPTGHYLAYPEIEEVYEVVDDGDSVPIEYSSLSHSVRAEIEDAAANVLVEIERKSSGSRYDEDGEFNE